MLSTFRFFGPRCKCMLIANEQNRENLYWLLYHRPLHIQGSMAVRTLYVHGSRTCVYVYE